LRDTLTQARVYVKYIVALFSVGTAYAETWSCVVNEKIGNARIQQYRVEGKVLKELTADKLLRELMPKSDEFLGPSYNILLNNKDALIAESDYSGLNSEKVKEIYVVNIIIDRRTGNLIMTSILLHLPSPNEIETVYGSCTVDK
jgi:hypothetical protein